MQTRRPSYLGIGNIIISALSKQIDDFCSNRCGFPPEQKGQSQSAREPAANPELSGEKQCGENAG